MYIETTEQPRFYSTHLNWHHDIRPYIITLDNKNIDIKFILHLN